ncbi:MAG: MerC domain-containing protein [Pseudomonadota bacterium]
MKSFEFLPPETSDRLGVFLSFLCLAHCLILPPLLAIAPLFVFGPLPEWVHDSEWFHAMLLVPVVLISGPTLFAGGRLDKSIWVFATAAIGLLFVALTAKTEILEQILTVIGATLLIVAHVKNRKARRRA